jgi:hypothetical protein
MTKISVQMAESQNALLASARRTKDEEEVAIQVKSSCSKPSPSQHRTQEKLRPRSSTLALPSSSTCRTRAPTFKIIKLKPFQLYASVNPQEPRVWIGEYETEDEAKEAAAKTLDAFEHHRHNAG